MSEIVSQASATGVEAERAHDIGSAAGDQSRDVLDLSTSQPRSATSVTKREMPSIWVALSVLAVLAAALAWGLYVHVRREGHAKAAQHDVTDRVPRVQVTIVKAQTGPITLRLPGHTEAFDSASIYPRATGYISERRVDIGTRVNKGELLVHISAPDLDQQLAQAIAQLGQTKAASVQAEAQVGQAEANLALAKVNLARAEDLVKKGFETVQNVDTLQANEATQNASVVSAHAGVGVANANTKAQQATVDRLSALVAFENVVAPFDGVITGRNVDTGDLVNADSTSPSPMFTMIREDVLRVLVQVPQDAAGGVKDGISATVELPQLGSETVQGQVTRTSVALLSSARTLTTEIDVQNKNHELRSGLFTYVTLDIPRVRPDVSVPAEALIFGQGGMAVATVDHDDTIAIRPVRIFRDFGTSVDVANGLAGGERVVLDPPVTLKDRMRVDPTAVSQKPAEQ